MTIEPKNYSPTTVALHWLTAIAVVAMFGVGLYMTSLPKGPARGEWFGLHKSLGLCVLALAVIRLAWRTRCPPPAFPPEWPAIEGRLALWGHRMLYVLLIVAPVAGYLTSAYTVNPIKFWGLAIPRLVEADQAMNALWKGVHNTACLALAIVIAGHALAAARHFLRGSRRMFGCSVQSR